MSKGLTKGPVNTGVAKWQEDLRASAFDGITAGDVKAIVARLVKDAKDGNPTAVKLVFDYILGGKAAISE